MVASPRRYTGNDNLTPPFLSARIHEKKLEKGVYDGMVSRFFCKVRQWSNAIFCWHPVWNRHLAACPPPPQLVILKFYLVRFLYFGYLSLCPNVPSKAKPTLLQKSDSHRQNEAQHARVNCQTFLSGQSLILLRSVSDTALLTKKVEKLIVFGFVKLFKQRHRVRENRRSSGPTSCSRGPCWQPVTCGWYFQQIAAKPHFAKGTAIGAWLFLHNAPQGELYLIFMFLKQYVMPAFNLYKLQVTEPVYRLML